VKAGRLRELAVTSAQRVPAFAELPTMSEAGLAGIEVTAWAGLIVPRGVPKDITDHLNKEVNVVLNTAAVREKVVLQGIERVGGTAEQFTAHIVKVAIKWADVVKRAGVRVD
jgi:tripartite-type tricarboxylate transporter receptor subunit TctC